MPTFYQNYLAMSNTANGTGGKPIAVLLQSISGLSTINPLVVVSMEEREMCYCFILSRTPHETNINKTLNVYIQLNI
jgi:hypothetical protein